MSSSQTRKRSSKLHEQRESIGDVAKRQVKLAGATAQDAVTSKAWLYPLIGIYYLLTHPALFRPLLPTLFKGILMSIGVVVALFTFTYLPQVAALAFVSGPLAFVLAVPLLLSEAYVVVNYLTRALLVGQAGTDLFDAVLLQRGLSTLVERGRQVNSAGGKTKALGSLIGKPLSRFSTDNLVRYLLTLPLNLIPVVGTAFFLGYNGYKAGPGYHARYFQLKGYDKDRRHAAVSKRHGAYTAFGTVAMALNLIPAVSILFTFTTLVGAALWASDIENKGQNSALENHGGSEVEVILPESAKKDAGKKEL